MKIQFKKLSLLRQLFSVKTDKSEFEGITQKLFEKSFRTFKNFKKGIYIIGFLEKKDHLLVIKPCRGLKGFTEDYFSEPFF